MINKNFFNISKYYNNVLFESENFIVIPSVGSLVKGWLLILPKEYFLSFGLINNTKLYSEFKKLQHSVLDILTKEFGSVVMFEHGPTIENSIVGCGVDYAHMHLVPLNINLLEESTSKMDLEWLVIDDISCTSQMALDHKPYLYFSDSKKHFMATSNEIPSQFFRRIIAEQVGLENYWDWKKFDFKENILSTINCLKKYQECGVRLNNKFDYV
jgi:diadenosine tetraphosphate (Ap4A) HIT family hydrolase